MFSSSPFETALLLPDCEVELLVLSTPTNVGSWLLLPVALALDGFFMFEVDVAGEEPMDIRDYTRANFIVTRLL